jgi:hypothetical protein
MGHRHHEGVAGTMYHNDERAVSCATCLLLQITLIISSLSMRALFLAVLLLVASPGNVKQLAGRQAALLFGKVYCVLQGLADNAGDTVFPDHHLKHMMHDLIHE